MHCCRLAFPILIFLYTLVLFSTGSLGARSYPLSYVYPGYYYWGTGRLYRQSLSGVYWSSTIYHSSDSYRLGIDDSRLIKTHTGNKREGRALRCVVRLIC